LANEIEQSPNLPKAVSFALLLSSVAAHGGL
jgi:hypothetical protein